MSGNESYIPQHVNEILDRGTVAAAAFANFDHRQVQKIVTEVARISEQHSERLAYLAAEETGFGVAKDKVEKNLNTVREFMRQYGNQNYCDHRVDESAKILRTPRPAGLIFAVTQSTSPTAAVFFKVLCAMITRSAILISPHPSAKRVSVEAAELLARAAENAGAPRDVIQIIAEPSIPLVEAVMGDDRVRLVVATGGLGVVQAAYRSGTPALGVGPGNPPIVVDETADLRAAAKGIIASKVFDNSILCTTDSVVFAVQSIADSLLNELRTEGAYICNPIETDKVRSYVYPGGTLNTQAVGRTAVELAEKSGISVPVGTTALVTPFTQVVDEEPFTHEKLCPVLGFHVVPDFQTGLERAKAMLGFVGAGHSAGIYSTDAQRVLDYSYALPVYRFAVNTSACLSNAGIGTHLPVTMSIGTGLLGGSASAENLNPEHFVQWAQTAYASDQTVRFPEFSGMKRSEWTHPRNTQDPNSEILADLRRIVLEELQNLMRTN